MGDITIHTNDLHRLLAADEAEREALLGLAEDCPMTIVTYEPVP
ncbi:hypothetical protein ACWD5B_09930 [Streptomyces tanashiensis]